MHGTETSLFASEAERRRVRAVVETLARTPQPGCSAAEVAHDARNMVTALELYCDLLGEPVVLSTDFFHYASELKLVASASRRLVEKLMLLDGWETGAGAGGRVAGEPLRTERMTARSARMVAEQIPGAPIDDFAQALEASRNLLDAITGLAITVAVKTEGGARPVRLSEEDLTRVLVNLVKNASEAMRRAGRIEIGLSERSSGKHHEAELVLTVEDTGPGIREGLLDRIFEPGFTTHATATGSEGDGGWPAAHRGLGLSITRTIVEAAGGSIHAENRTEGGARMIIALPARKQ